MVVGISVDPTNPSVEKTKVLSFMPSIWVNKNKSKIAQISEDLANVGKNNPELAKSTTMTTAATWQCSSETILELISNENT